MTYTVDSPIVHAPTGTLAEALAWLDIKPGAETEYATELWRLCTLVGLDPALLFAQAAHETGDFSSAWWLNRRNPAGIGITGDAVQNELSQKWANGTNAAQGQIFHMCAYVGIKPPFPDMYVVSMDRRNGAVYQAGYAGTVRTLNDLTGKWAVDPNYATKIAAKANRIFPNAQEVQPVSNELRIILNPGHRNSTGGNDEEQAMTPALAQSYFDAFTKAGYETVNLGDTNGGLDETCRRMAAMIASAPGKCVLLDLHYEGSPAPGVFCIVPDVTGLTTGAPVPQDPLDTWDNNRDDTELGNAIAVKISMATGLKLRTSGIRTPGLMDESQTGVGGDGYRLATFAYTSPYRTKAVRLVVEHGNHTVQPDRSIIMQPDFTDKCADAAVAAVKMVYGGTTTYPPTSPPWPVGTLGWKQINGIPVYALVAEVEVVAKGGLTPYVSVNGAESGPKYKQGAKVKVIGSFATDVTVNGKPKKKPWIILADGSRAEGSRTRPKLPYQP